MFFILRKTGLVLATTLYALPAWSPTAESQGGSSGQWRGGGRWGPRVPPASSLVDASPLLARALLCDSGGVHTSPSREGFCGR